MENHWATQHFSLCWCLGFFLPGLSWEPPSGILCWTLPLPAHNKSILVRESLSPWICFYETRNSSCYSPAYNSTLTSHHLSIQSKLLSRPTTFLIWPLPYAFVSWKASKCKLCSSYWIPWGSQNAASSLTLQALNLFSPVPLNCLFSTMSTFLSHLPYAGWDALTKSFLVHLYVLKEYLFHIGSTNRFVWRKKKNPLIFSSLQKQTKNYNATPLLFAINKNKR